MKIELLEKSLNEFIDHIERAIGKSPTRYDITVTEDLSEWPGDLGEHFSREFYGDMSDWGRRDYYEFRYNDILFVIHEESPKTILNSGEYHEYDADVLQELSLACQSLIPVFGDNFYVGIRTHTNEINEINKSISSVWPSIDQVHNWAIYSNGFNFSIPGISLSISDFTFNKDDRINVASIIDIKSPND